MILPTFIIAISTWSAAPDDNVCVPAEDGRSWVCGTRADPPQASGSLPDAESERLPPRDDPQLEVFAIPTPAQTRTKAIPGSPLLQDAQPVAPVQADQPVAQQPAPTSVPDIAAGKFTLLLASLTSVPDLMSFAEDFEVDLSRAARVPILVNGTARHVLIFGRFETAEAARSAIPNLPYVLQSMRPTAVSLDRYANDPVPLVETPQESVVAANPVVAPEPAAPEIDEPLVEATASSETIAAALDPAPLPAAGEVERDADPAPDPMVEKPEADMFVAETDGNEDSDPILMASDLPPSDLPPLESPEPEAGDGQVTELQPEPTEPAVAPSRPSANEGAALAANNPFALPEADERDAMTRRQERQESREASEQPSVAVSQVTEARPLTRPRASWRGAEEFARADGGYTVQMAVRPSVAEAESLAVRLDLDPTRTYFVPYRGNVLVLVGRYGSISDAKRALEQLPGLDNPPWVRRAKPLTRQ